MPLPTPNLDDRNFDDLVRAARERIVRSCPEWTDLTPSDPGIVLLDVFAYLTDQMLYRLNRLPDKAYVAFLNLIGVRITPPAAARTSLHFSRAVAAPQPLVIPRGTRVSLARPDPGGEPPVFQTVATATIAAGQQEVDVDACQCEQVEAELAGYGTGAPGLSLTALRPPIVAPTGDGLDLLVGVEATADELGTRAPAIQYQNKAFRLWQEVATFTHLGSDRAVFVADRTSGVITFAPAVRLAQPDGALTDQPEALADVPAQGREVRLWYWRGGGPAGNVAANTLTTLKDVLPGLQVTNPQPASGGRAAESPDNALVRGPQSLHSLRSIVTADDYERVATETSPGVARASAFTRSAIWTFATPGTVEVLLVPAIPESALPDGRAAEETLQQHQVETARVQVQQALEARRSLGTICLVNWAHYKTVSVSARIVVGRQEDAEGVRQRVTARLNRTISPLPTELNPTGWGFGLALRASNVFDIALREPGVRWVDRVTLEVKEVPERVNVVVADAFQPSTWYASSDSTLFRSLNDGDSWEPVVQFAEGSIECLLAHPERPGLLAAVTRLADGSGSHVHMSNDCGETWTLPEQSFGFVVEDLAWTSRDDTAVLLLATDRGLYQLVLTPGSSPVQVLVDASNPARPLYAVAANRDVSGRVSVAVATQSEGGVFISHDGGNTGTYHSIGLQNEDIRILTVQRLGPRSFLWAGEAAPGGDDPGKGCFSWELTGGVDPADGWHAFSGNWTGGSVRAIGFLGTAVFAASHHAGVLHVDSQTPGATWQAPNVSCGLPLRDRDRFLFQAIDSVAADPAGRLLLAGVVGADPATDPGQQPGGIFRSTDSGVEYERVSRTDFNEIVQLPATWLFCSGEHSIVVETDDAAS